MPYINTSNVRRQENYPQKYEKYDFDEVRRNIIIREKSSWHDMRCYQNFAMQILSKGDGSGAGRGKPR